jgi:glycosyltransferase involved in cell wall biosynthesis
VAYLVTQYPQTSHSFIRREIAALESMGVTVQRYSLRATIDRQVDEQDEAERSKTRAVLGVGAAGLIAAMLHCAALRPLALIRAARLAWRLGRHSERGVLIHLIYLAEASVLCEWLSVERVQHVHAHFGTNSATVAMLCASLGGPSYSFTAHGPDEFDRPLALGLEEKIRRAAFVVAISEYGRSQLYRWIPHSQWGKVYIVRCGLDGLFLNNARPSSPPAARRLVCVGRLAEQKGQLVLIEAAGRLRADGVDFDLTLVGDGPMRGEIEALIDRLGLGDRVHLIGWLSNASVREQILGSRALVLPSFAEGLPVVLMEALALDRPVVSTYVAGIPELVQPGVSGWLVPPGSVEALVDALREVLDAPLDQLARMGRAGNDRVAQFHNAHLEAEKLALLFQDFHDQTSVA